MTANTEPNKAATDRQTTRAAMIETIVSVTGTDWCAGHIADAILAKWHITPTASDPRTSDHE